MTLKFMLQRNYQIIIIFLNEIFACLSWKVLADTFIQIHAKDVNFFMRHQYKSFRKFLKIIKTEPTASKRKIFEKIFRFHVKQHTTEKVQNLIFSNFYQTGELGYDSMQFLQLNEVFKFPKAMSLKVRLLPFTKILFHLLQ